MRNRLMFLFFSFAMLSLFACGQQLAPMVDGHEAEEVSGCAVTEMLISPPWTKKEGGDDHECLVVFPVHRGGKSSRSLSISEVECALCQDTRVECIGSEGGRDLLRVAAPGDYSSYDTPSCGVNTLFILPTKWSSDMREHTDTVLGDKAAVARYEKEEAEFIERQLERHRKATESSQ